MWSGESPLEGACRSELAAAYLFAESLRYYRRAPASSRYSGRRHPRRHPCQASVARAHRQIVQIRTRPAMHRHPLRPFRAESVAAEPRDHPFEGLHMRMAEGLRRVGLAVSSQIQTSDATPSRGQKLTKFVHLACRPFYRGGTASNQVNLNPEERSAALLPRPAGGTRPPGPAACTNAGSDP